MFKVKDGDIFTTNKGLNRGCVKVFGKISHLNLTKKKKNLCDSYEKGLLWENWSKITECQGFFGG
jgi:hypothetical protein